MSKRNIFAVGLVIAVLAGGVWMARRDATDGKMASGEKAKKDAYQCSMHPEVISDKPGNCPICGMRLTKVEQAETEPSVETARTGEKKAKPMFYRHPMNPEITSPVPAKDEMGMDYIPVFEEATAGTAEGTVEGHAPFTLSTERQQMIGVKTTRVEKTPLTLEIRSVGRVAYDPELYNAIAEYKEALAARKKLSPAAAAETRERVNALVKAARLRLRVMGITDEQLPQMISEAADPTSMLLPGKSVWVYAQVYEYEADSVRAGQTAVVTVPTSRERTYEGRVAAVDPVLDPTTRTLRVRIKVKTPEERLKPESFVHVKIRVPLGRVLAVPEDALLDTGENQLVFIKTGQGRFEPRAIRLGREAQGHYEVLSGLEEGEEIVTSANFLIDSESRFRAAVAAFSGKKSTAPAKGHAH